MTKKVGIIIFLIGICITSIYFYTRGWAKFNVETSNLLSPVGNVLFKEKHPWGGKELNFLLIGTDTSIGRKSRGQLGYNTDVMILVSINPDTNRVLLTSVPRDLWVNGNKMNALDIIYGYEVLEDAFQKITGQEIDGYIKADFDAFEWLIDSMGGVPVTVERSFSDSSFPDIYDSGPIFVTFTQGYEKMDGPRALTFARSRKGNNGEGSDLMRAKRQHLILQGMVSAISQPESIFWPIDIPNFYETITQHIETSLALEDIYYIWDFYKDRPEYQIESFVVDGEYVYHPGMYPQSDYHAWVFVPRNGSFSKLHTDIDSKLEGTFVKEPENIAGAEDSQVSN